MNKGTIRKNSAVIALVIIGATAACSPDEMQIDCNKTPQPVECQDHVHGGYYHGYIYRTYYGGRPSYSTVHSVGFSEASSFGSVVRGGFGSVGHGFSSGS